MFFFVNVGLGASNSGVESAILERMTLFKKLGEKSVFLAMDYFSSLHTEGMRRGLRTDEIFSIYDFFLGTVELSVEPMMLDDLVPPIGLEEKNSNDTFRRFYDKNGVMRYEARNYGPGEIMFRESWYDAAGHVIESTRYDTRGFKAMTETFVVKDDHSELQMRDFYTPAGEHKLHIVLSHERGDFETFGLVQLFNYKGHDYQFMGQAEFYRFALDEINESYHGNNAFIIERGLRFSWAATHMKTRAYLAGIIHSMHLNSLERPYGLVNYQYENLFENLDAYQSVLISSAVQYEQIQKRWHEYNGFRMIPVGVVSEELMGTERQYVADRRVHGLITLSRLDPYKRTIDVVAAMPQIIAKIPDATLHIYGLGSEESKIREMIQNLGMQTHVFLMGHTEDSLAALANAQLFVSAAHYEGFGLSTLEAISVGTPALTFDVLYGPREIVQDGVNGWRLPLQNDSEENIAELANQIIAAFSDDDRFNKLIDKTYDSRVKFSEKNIAEKWQNWIDEYKEWRLKQ
jgi:poly(glycerol-phosphate) alpha-glucosyltransferase